MQQADVERGEVPVPHSMAANKGEMTLKDYLKSKEKDNGQPLRGLDSNDSRILRKIKKGYTNDKLFCLILENVETYPAFTISKGIIWKKGPQGERTICVPREREIITQVLDQAHKTIGHFGDLRTYEHVRRWYWWPTMRRMFGYSAKHASNANEPKGRTKNQWANYTHYRSQ